jgi:hypothetical protein
LFADTRLTHVILHAVRVKLLDHDQGRVYTELNSAEFTTGM